MRKSAPVNILVPICFPSLAAGYERHYHGPAHGISTESLSFIEVQVSTDEDEAEPVTTLLSVEARVCPKPESLFLRIQQWALISFTKRDMIHSKTEFVTICDHITSRSSEVSRLMEFQLEAPRTGSECREWPDVLKRRYRNTDFQVETKELGDQGLALVITKWLDLGPGLTPKDTRWRVHIARDKAAEIGRLGHAGDIRLRFESEPGLSQDSLSRRNASYLTDKRFMNAMDRWNNKTWILQGGKRLPFSYYPDRVFFLALALSNLSLYLWLVFLYLGGHIRL